ncbi:MAG: PhoH family protein [Planctomycetes bacterium]|nr:PhoH family protein [Planctomycetota bacterium]
METRIPLLTLDEQRQLFGPFDRHVKELDKRFGVRMVAREGTLRLVGPKALVAATARRVQDVLGDVRTQSAELPPAEIEARLLGELTGAVPAPMSPKSDSSERKGPQGSSSNMPTPRTPVQEKYMASMRSHELVLAAGPAGTGKTFLAVAAAVQHLQAGRVNRIILTRPAVEAGESLGFLPGDFEAKVDPYLRPLYDALRDILGPTGVRKLKSLDQVEIAPLAFMRGRTLSRSFIILDEAQNCTPGQMKMFLTRIGEGSKAVVTGDHTQTDLEGKRSGLVDVMDRLGGVPGVDLVHLQRADIQRSGIVQRIVETYEDSP